MYVRIDRTTRRPCRMSRSRTPCRCEFQILRTTAYPRVVCNEQRDRGSRQRTVLRLPSYRSCCFVRKAAQKAFWEEVDRRLDLLEQKEGEAFQRREIVLRIAKAISRDLAPFVRQDSLKEGEGSKVLDRRAENGQVVVRILARPDLSRLSALPGILAPEITEAAKVRRGAERLLELGPEHWDVGAFELKGTTNFSGGGVLLGRLRRLADLSPQEGRTQAADLAQEARLSALRAEHAPPDHLGGPVIERARDVLREFVASSRSGPRGSPNNARFFRQSARGGSTLRYPEREFLASLAPESLVAVAAYVGGQTQVEAGRIAFASTPDHARQRRVSRHLGSFRNALRKLLSVPTPLLD